LTTPIREREESAMNTTIAELDHRKSGPFEVSLLWHRDIEAVSLTIHDNRSGRSLELPVVHDRALQAFKHPFAFAASGGVDLAAGLGVARPLTPALGRFSLP
jgi:hypothetical protein